MVSKGAVRDKSSEFLQLSAKLAPGNSGGPVLDTNQRVIGIAVAVGFGCSKLQFAGVDWEVDCGIAIPIELVKAKLQHWGI